MFDFICKEASLILEEIHRAGGNAAACHAQMYTMGTLLRHGSDELKTRYLPDIALPAALHATADLAAACAGADVVVFAVPSHGLRAVLADARPHIAPSAAIVSLVKGIEQGTLLRMTEVIADVLVEDGFDVKVRPCVVASESGSGSAFDAYSIARLKAPIPPKVIAKMEEYPRLSFQERLTGRPPWREIM